MREREWKWSRWKRSCASILSKFGVQLLWTTSSQPVKGAITFGGLIRHGAVVCRIVNWMGLTAYNVTSPLNIWTKFGVWLPRRFCGPPSKEENCVVSIIFFIEWTAKGVEVCWIASWNFEWWNERTWMKLKRSRWNRSWVYFLSKFCVQLPWTTSSPHVKGDYHVFSNTGFIRHGAVVCRIVNWKQLTAYNVASPLNIWTKFRVWLLWTLFWSTHHRRKLCHIYFLFYWVEGRGGVGGIVTVKCEYSTYYSSLFGPSNEL